MSSPVYIIGAFTTPFGRQPDVSLRSLARQAVEGVLEDASDLETRDIGARIDAVAFGNCGMHHHGQANVRGHVCLSPLIDDGVLPAHVPITNVEAACATGALAFHSAFKDVAAGLADVALAVGVEKVFMPEHPERMRALYEGALDQLDPARWRAYYEAAEDEAGWSFEPDPRRLTLLDVCAMRAAWHMKTYGTTREQMAISSAKNHDHGALNPNAQYGRTMSIAEVLDDKPVIGPLTRSMCSPISDGAAAVLVCSEEALGSLGDAVSHRAVHVRAAVMTSGVYRDLGAPSLARVAADRAYELAGVGPDDVDVCELHDATSFDELYLCEMLRFCEEGGGGEYVASGATTRGGARPVNTSGGLVSKGHPLAASGLGMLHELVTQLRGEAGERQVEGPNVALAQNGGGLMGFDEAACGVTVLSRD